MSARADHQLINSSDSVEWFTPARYIEAAREVLGEIDLDPTSCEAANQIVQADRYFTEAENGYLQEWRGRIFLNPPYVWCHPDGRRREKGGISAQGHWTKRLIDQYQKGLVTEAVLLVSANTGEQWFQPLWKFSICFVGHRIKFIKVSDVKKQGPTKSNCFVYFGDRPDRFAEVFRRFGRVIFPTTGAHHAGSPYIPANTTTYVHNASVTLNGAFGTDTGRLALPKMGDKLDLNYSNLLIGDGWKWCPKWLRIELTTDIENGKATAIFPDITIKSQSTIEIRLATCRHCGGYYATWYIWQSLQASCRRCERSRAAARKREKRRKASVLPSHCDHCGEALKASRTTKRYCGAGCRVAAHRAKSSALTRYEVLMEQRD